MIPIDRIGIALGSFDLIGSQPVREKHSVETIPARAWNNQAVKSQEIGGVRYVLGSAIFTVDVARRVDTQSIEARKISEPKR